MTYVLKQIIRVLLWLLWGSQEKKKWENNNKGGMYVSTWIIDVLVSRQAGAAGQVSLVSTDIYMYND